MLQPRIASREASLNSLAIALNNLALCSRHAPKRQQPQLIFSRNASHAAQGRANGPKDSAGRRLGAKKTASQYVIPGNIIFKQRGTKWFAGENVGIGKDHTIYSTVYGYVRYYRNPAVHPKRRYIGVALEKEGPGSQLPSPVNAPTRRRLGFHTVPRKPDPEAIPDDQLLDAHAVVSQGDGSIDKVPVPKQASTAKPVQMFSLKPFEPGHTTRRGGYGIANWEIGRAAEHKGIDIKPFDRTDRWRAWRQRTKRVKTKQLAKAAKARSKTKGKKSNKKIAAG